MQSNEDSSGNPAPISSVLCAGMLLALVLALPSTSCSASRYSGLAIEFRVVASSDENCVDCIAVEFSNPLTHDAQLMVPRSPSLVVAPSSITRFEAVSFGDSGVPWKASIIVDGEARNHIKRLAVESSEAQTLVLVSVGGESIDLVPARELGGILVLGRFGSPEEVGRAFAVASEMGKRVLTSDPIPSGDAEAQMRETDDYIESTRRQEPLLDAIDGAVREGRFEEAERLSEQLD